MTTTETSTPNNPAATAAATTDTGAATAAATAAATTTDPAAGDAGAAATTAQQTTWWDGKITEPEIIEFAKAKNYQSPEEALRAAWSANKMNKLEPYVTAVLEGKANDEQRAAFYRKLGRPDNSEGYKFQPKEGVVVDDRMLALGRDIFFELGANPEQAQKAFDVFNEKVMAMNAEEAQAAARQNEAELDALSKKWGDALDANKAAGLRVLDSLVKSGKVEAGIMGKVEQHIGAAALVELLAAVGNLSGEGALVSNAAGSRNPSDPRNMNAEQARAKIAELANDSKFQESLRDTANPARTANLTLWEQLHAVAG